MSNVDVMRNGQLEIRIKDLPSVPVLVTDALRVIDASNSSMLEIEAVVMRDQALAAKVLRVVNSVAFGMRRQIETVREACTIMGTRKVRAIASAMLASGLFAKRMEGLVEPKRVWAHALASSVWVMEIIDVMKRWDVQSAVMAALLHDIGIVLLCEHATDRYQRVLEMSRDEGLHHSVVEKRELGITHAFVGASLCAKWALPVAVTQLVGYHHETGRPADPAQAVLILADYLASENDFKPFDWSVQREMPNVLLDLLKMDDAKYATLCERGADVHSRVNAMLDVFLEDH